MNISNQRQPRNTIQQKKYTEKGINRKIEPSEIKCTALPIKYNIHSEHTISRVKIRFFFTSFLRPFIRFLLLLELAITIWLRCWFDKVVCTCQWNTLIYRRHSVIAFGSMTEISRRFKLRHRLMFVLLESILSTFFNTITIFLLPSMPSLLSHSFPYASAEDRMHRMRDEWRHVDKYNNSNNNSGSNKNYTNTQKRVD